MSKRVLICLSGNAYHETTRRIVQDGPKFGADEVRVYDDRWLLDHPHFTSVNKDFWAIPKKMGFHWCCWKPLIILDELKRLTQQHFTLVGGAASAFPIESERAVVLYTDADTYPIADLTPIFEFAERDGIVLFEAQGCPNKRFTRRDCAVAMGLDEERHWNALHACGRFSAFRVGYYPAWQLLIEWLTYSVNPMCQLIEPSRYCTEFPEYFRHSNEQSVLTLLASKYAIPLHREACQFGWPPAEGHGQPEDTYPQLFHQEWCGGDRADVSGSKFRNV